MGQQLLRAACSVLVLMTTSCSKSTWPDAAFNMGPAGGPLSFASGAVSLNFPAGAVPANVNVTATAATGASYPTVVPGTVYEFGPSMTFSSPVHLTLHYAPASIPTGVLATELGLYKVVGGGWARAAGSTVDTTHHTITASLSSFSTYGILGAPVASVVVVPGTPSVTVGLTTPLTATPKDSGGTALPNRAVAWSSSTTSVATVSAGGVVTGVSAGTDTVTATSEGVSGKVVVTVQQVPVATVTVAPATATVNVAATQQLTATTKDAGGNTLTGRTVTWTTSNAAVATVSGTGLVTGVAAGTDTVTATSETVTGTAVITVQLVPVATVTVAPATATINVAATQQLTATTKDAGGNTLTGRSVTWTTSNAGVATVSGTGLVTGVAAGTDTVTATSEAVTGKAVITVQLVPVVTVTVAPATATLSVGGTQQLTATLKDVGGNTLTGRTVTWTTSSASVATVTSGGLVTAVALGTDTVTATSGAVSGTSVITVATATAPTVTGLSRDGGSAAGGAPVVITGTGFVSGASVLFGSTASPSVTVNSATQITATTPAHTVGVVDVAVSQSGLVGTLSASFEYMPAATTTFVTHDFEDGTVGGFTADVSGDGLVQIVNDVFHSGSHSARMTRVTGSTARLQYIYANPKNPPLTAPGLYQRWYVRLDHTNFTGQIKLLLSRYAAAPATGYPWLMMGIGDQFWGAHPDHPAAYLDWNIVEYDPGGPSDSRLPVAFAPNQWYEVETWYYHDGTRAHFRLWVDGKKMMDGSSLAGGNPGWMGYDSVTGLVDANAPLYWWFGMAFTQGFTGALTVWVDDAAAANGFLDPVP